MRCQKLAAYAAGLAALPPDDPERRAAETHAAGCPDCRAAMREATQLQALLGGVAPPPAPDAPTRARAGRAIQAAVASERRDRGGWIVGSLAAVTALVLVAWDLPSGSAGALHGFKCLGLELGGAAAFLLAGLVALRRHVTPGIAAAAAGVGALAVQRFVTQGCGAASMAHDLGFHVSANLLVLALAGVAALRFSKERD